MSLLAFLDALFEGEPLRVPAPGQDLAIDESELDGFLATFERQYRLELPGEAPQLRPDAARWGAITIYRACQFLTFRDTGEERVQAELTKDLLVERDAATHYSVDLALRFLPDVSRLANPADPLIGSLEALGRRWPLSSIGMANVNPESLDGVVDNPCLLALYVDRVIAAQDASRLADARVREAVRCVAGAHVTLVGKEIAAALEGA